MPATASERVRTWFGGTLNKLRLRRKPSGAEAEEAARGAGARRVSRFDSYDAAHWTDGETPTGAVDEHDSDTIRERSGYDNEEEEEEDEQSGRPASPNLLVRVLTCQVIRPGAAGRRRAAGAGGKGALQVTLNEPRKNRARLYPSTSNNIYTTRYTPLTFLPKNLLEQFRRWVMVYFLLFMCANLVSGAVGALRVYQTPGGVSVAAVIPLTIVVVVTMVKDGFEDYLRYRQDRRANAAAYEVVQPGSAAGEIKPVRSAKLRVGDVVRLRDDDDIPADMVALASSANDGHVYLETSSLDGESNLKRFTAAMPDLSAAAASSSSSAAAAPAAQVAALRGDIHFERPSTNLNSFVGRLDDKPLTREHLLLRGAVLKNTGHVFGVVVYAGMSTKLMLNSKPPVSKFTRLDRALNHVYGVVFAYLFVWLTALAIAAGITYNTYDDWWYIGTVATQFSAAAYGCLQWIAFLILGGSIVPIAAYITLELVRLGAMYFAQWDERLRTGDRYCRVNNANVMTDLGDVRHVFTDKTGTLTRNVMQFAECAVRGRKYGADIDASETHFLRAMALCHSVLVVGGRYEGTNTDEVAFVEAAARNGVRLVARTNDEMVLEEHGRRVSFEVLAMVEFASERQRMSIVVRRRGDADGDAGGDDNGSAPGQVWLLTKGADSALLPLCREDDAELVSVTERHVNDFATRGLRTLVFAERVLDADAFKAWNERLQQAELALQAREARIYDAWQHIERDFSLLGVTGVEDRLQEQVPHTIETIRLAGIKLWVLTGDRVETALDVARLARVLTPDMRVHVVRGGAVKHHSTVLAQLLLLDDAPAECLVMESEALTLALKYYPRQFIERCSRCSIVLCCRTKPLDKAWCVRAVRRRLRATTCAIGDGGNDVSMLMEADVGVGIQGLEGTQAARAADVAVGEFRHLKRLLLLYGRYSNVRVHHCLAAIFYKAMANYSGSFWFQLWTSYSAMPLAETWFASTYELIYTGLPPLVLGLFERDLDERTIELHPEAYASRTTFSLRSMARWLVSGLWHSLVLSYTACMLFTPHLGGTDVHSADGRVSGMRTLQVFYMTALVLVVLGKISIETLYWTWLNAAAIGLCLALYFVYLLLLNTVFWVGTSGGAWIGVKLYWVFFSALSNGAYFYLYLAVAVCLCLLPELLWMLVQQRYAPRYWQVLRNNERRGRRGSGGSERARGH